MENKSESYLVSFNRLFRYFQRQQAGYSFACISTRELQLKINNELRTALARINISLQEISIEPESELTIIGQIKSVLNSDALIVNNLSDLLHVDTTLISDGSFKVLSELNFGREALLGIGKPVLFWLQTESLSIVSNHAADLYSQRSHNIIYFDNDNSNELSGKLETQDNMEETTDDSDQQKTVLKIKLLEKQLRIAELNHYPKQLMIKEIVLPLADAYAEIDKQGKVSRLISRYEGLLQELNPEMVNDVSALYRREKPHQK